MPGKGRFGFGLTIMVIMSLLCAAGAPHVGAKQTGVRPGSIQIEAKNRLAIEPNASANHTSDLVIIQFTGPIQEKWKEEVEDLGVRLGDYIPDYAFIAKLEDPGLTKRVEKLAYVEKLIPFQPVTKTASPMRAAKSKKKSAEVAVIGFDRQVDIRPSTQKMSTMLGNGLEELEEDIFADDVIAVIPLPENKLHNDRAAALTKSDKLLATSYMGEGQVIGVADTGLDTGDEASMHPDFQGQIKSLYAIGRKGDASDPHGHGTHIAGSLIGTGEASDGKYKGLAPEARLVFHSIQDRDGGLRIDVDAILSEAYADGARIHSDSWGADDDGEYSLTSYLFDRFLWEHPDMTALVATGNTGYRGFQTVGSPATAKNVIAVGASENDRPKLGSWSDDPDQIWRYSSRGLTTDGRLKPDLVAPGTSILSTRSALAPSTNFDRGFDEHYAYMSGTSMAAPILAGGVAQVRQFLQAEGQKKPSSALIKAMLLTGVEDLGEDMRLQGFGRADLLQAIEAGYKDEKKGMRTRDKMSYTVHVSDATRPFVTTLAWTDYPASLVATRTLVNDLNLQVTTPSGEKLNGNDFFEVPFDDEVDNVNNVEQVWIGKPETGIYTVTVEGYNIPKGPQPYALATTGEWGSRTSEEAEEQGDQLKGTLTKKHKYADYTIRVTKPGKLKLSVEWEGRADVDVYVYDNRKKAIASAKRTDNPETIVTKLAEAGLYHIRVALDDGAKAAYRLDLSYPGK